MGRYDPEELYAAPEAQRFPAVPGGGNRYAPEALYPAPTSVPQRAPAEMRSYTPSPTQRFKYMLQDALMGAGAQPHVARHLAEGTTGIAGMTPLGSVFSAADLPYNASRGNYMSSAFDVLGTLPGVQAIRRFAGGMPRVRPGEVPPPWVERGSPESRGWVTPSTEELIGRGQTAAPGRPAIGLLPVEPPRPAVPPGAAQQAYADVRNSPLGYHPDVGSNFAIRARTHIESPGGGSFSPEGVPAVYNILDRFENAWAGRGRPVTASDWDTMRQQLRNLEGKEGAAGSRVANMIDHYMVNPPPGAFVSGGPADLAELTANLQRARGNYRAGKTAETVENAIDRSGTRAGATYSGMNVDNATRQRLEALQAADAPYPKLIGATDAELAAIRDASQGDWLTNQMRAAGKVMGGGGGLGRLAATSAGSSGAAGLAHTMGLDPATTAAAAVAGGAVPFFGGRALLQSANERTVQAAEEVANRIRRNSPEYASRVAATPTVTDPRAMLADAMIYTMTPQVRQQGQEAWQGLYTPYEDRQGEGDAP